MQQNYLVPHINHSRAVSTRPTRSDASRAKAIRPAINSPDKSTHPAVLTVSPPTYNSSSLNLHSNSHPMPSPTPSSNSLEPHTQAGETKKAKKRLWGMFSRKTKGALQPANVNTESEKGKSRSTPNLLDMEWSTPPLLEPQSDISGNTSSYLAPKTPMSFLAPPSPVIYFGIDDIWDGETVATDVMGASRRALRGRAVANVPTDISDDDFDEPSPVARSTRGQRQRAITSRSQHTNRWAIHLGMD